LLRCIMGLVLVFTILGLRLRLWLKSISWISTELPQQSLMLLCRTAFLNMDWTHTRRKAFFMT
jgi:hypothetical protein